MQISCAQRQIKSHAYHEEKWESMKPLLRNLYMEECLSLQAVAALMAKEWRFYPTLVGPVPCCHGCILLTHDRQKMYKLRFTRWGWRKNKTKHNTSPKALPRGLRRRNDKPRPIVVLPPIRSLRSPEAMRTHEIGIFAVQSYIRAQFDSFGWGSNPFTFYKTYRTTEVKPQLDFYGFEISVLYCMHHIKQRRMKLAFEMLRRIFDDLKGTWVVSHPKVVAGYLNLLRKVYGLCVMVEDHDFALLREFMRYQGEGAKEYLKIQQSDQLYLPKLWMNLAGMNKEDPEHLKHMFRTYLVAAVDCMEEKVGLDHPVVLQAWSNVSWYVTPNGPHHLHHIPPSLLRRAPNNLFSIEPEDADRGLSYRYWKLPILATKKLVTRFEALLDKAESAFGYASPITISIVHDLTIAVMNSRTNREYEKDLADDLLRRTAVHVDIGEPQDRTQILRAHAFATMLRGIFYLEMGQIDNCRRLFEDSIQWLMSGGPFAKIHGEMLAADLDMLIKAWNSGVQLRELDLNFLRPRCADVEREEIW